MNNIDFSNPGSLNNLSTDAPIDGANSAFLILATILVFLMVLGLGIFYQGLSRKKFALSIVMQSIISIPVTMIIWIFGGFGFIFGANIWGGFLGDPSLGFAFNNVISAGNTSSFTGNFIVNLAYAPSVPFILFWIFQLMFAIITPPLMVGAFSERMTWGKYLVFLVLWEYLIYIPVAHWIWGGGFLAALGVLDWAGGIVIHTTAGFGAIITAIMLGKRKLSKNKEENRPSSIPLILIGTTLLMFGWFGFNTGGGIAIGEQNAAKGHAIIAFINTTVAPSFSVVVWIIAEKIVAKKVSAIGIASAFIAGLAAITPASGYVPAWASMIIGALSGIVCYLAAILIKKSKFVDDALDVFPVHGVGGMLGSILIGALALDPISTSTAGVFVNLTNGYQLGIEILAIFLVMIWTSFFTFIIVLAIQKTPIKWGFKTYKNSFEEDIEEFGKDPLLEKISLSLKLKFNKIINKNFIFKKFPTLQF